MEILVNGTSVKIVYKRFSIRGGVLCSLAATGPLEKTYQVGTWTRAEQWLLSSGLGLFAFENRDHAVMGSCTKMGANYLVYCCMTTQVLPYPPPKILSMDEHNPMNLSPKEILRLLERSPVKLIEQGAIMCENILPIVGVA